MTQNSFDSMHRFEDALGITLNEIEFESDESALEAVRQVRSVFVLRETTYQERERSIQKMLDMYQKMYDNLTR